jgi:16S rRNA (guanine527-N7)-methyltransferase
MLDSLSIVPHLGDAARIVDVGTGGGFPGVPLAVACPQRHFTLIDGTAKKIRFVEEGVAALDIRNVQVAHSRAELYTGEKNFDVVVSRAIGALADVLHNASGLLAPHGRLFAMKGRSPEEELRAIPRGWHAEVIDLTVPGLDAERRLVVVSRQHRV